jgi:hypothetical protein
LLDPKRFCPQDPYHREPCRRQAELEKAIMTIAEQIQQITQSKELSDTEKLDQLHGLIPADSCKIDNLSQATREQLKQLKDGIAVTQAMQELRRRTAGKE